jgi:hypothetical protein
LSLSAATAAAGKTNARLELITAATEKGIIKMLGGVLCPASERASDSLVLSVSVCLSGCIIFMLYACTHVHICNTVYFIMAMGTTGECFVNILSMHIHTPRHSSL